MIDTKKEAPAATEAANKTPNTSILLDTAEATSLLNSFDCCFLKPGTKRPAGAEWQKRPQSPRNWNGQGIGVICGYSQKASVAVHALDIDATDVRLADAMELFLKQMLGERTGTALKRVGKAPKFAVPFQRQTEIKKRTTAAFYSHGAKSDNKNQLEILGAGNQLVAYGIHPGTGNPYQWTNLITGCPQQAYEVKPGNLVTLTDDDLTAIEQKFIQEAKRLGLQSETTRETPERPPRKAYKATSNTSGVIDKVNEQITLQDALEKHGYKRFPGGRYLFPGSSTGEPGVTIFTDDKDAKERCYSHHASDPLNDGHSHDTFSVLTMLEFGGDVSAAVAHLASIVDPDGQKKRQSEYIENSQALRMTPQELAKMEKSADQAQRNNPSDLPDYPCELLNLPYQLGELQAFIFNRMTYPSAATAGITAIATMTAFAQSNITIQSRDGLGFNEYFMILAPTGFGKEDLRKPVELLNDRAEQPLGVDKLKIRHAAPVSAQGIHQLIEQDRSTLFLSDEFAEWLRETKNNSQKQAALGYLMQAYSKALGTLDPGHAVTQSYTPVKRPRVSIIATSTGSAMFDTMTREHAESGAYNRWVIFPGDEELPQKRYTGLVYEPEQSLIDYITWLKSQSKGNQDTTVKFSPEGMESYIKLDQELAEPVKRKDPMLGGRLGEQAIKLAAVIALSDKRFEIQPSDLETAFNIRLGIYHRAYSLADREGNLGGQHKTGAALEAITKLFQRRESIYKSQLAAYSRSFKSLSVGDQEVVMKALINREIAKPCDGRNSLLISQVYNQG